MAMPTARTVATEIAFFVLYMSSSFRRESDLLIVRCRILTQSRDPG